MISNLLKAACFVALVAVSDVSHAQSSSPSKITGWKVSCGADKGALKKSKGNYVFRPSSNHCDGDSPWGWKQRTEVLSKKYSAKLKGRYLFETSVALTSSSSQKFVVFQMHDGRKACAPPLIVEWRSNNRIALVSAYKVAGRGEEHCIKNNIATANYQRGPILRRDGTEHLLQVLLDFDGSGAFDVAVAVDGKRSVEGRYDPNLPSRAVTSVTGIRMSSPEIDKGRNLYFKHGVYSQKSFKFVLISNGMRMVRLAR